MYMLSSVFLSLRCSAMLQKTFSASQNALHLLIFWPYILLFPAFQSISTTGLFLSNIKSVLLGTFISAIFSLTRTSYRYNEETLTSLLKYYHKIKLFLTYYLTISSSIKYFLSQLSPKDSVHCAYCSLSEQLFNSLLFPWIRLAKQIQSKSILPKITLSDSLCQFIYDCIFMDFQPAIHL